MIGFPHQAGQTHDERDARVALVRAFREMGRRGLNSGSLKTRIQRASPACLAA